ncbi:MAG: Gfo/Idh/MocA family oxidoreductase [Calditrichaeota bacterium]|nr:Gfo/Idh/MocA family oxidoreductase [Calditrichota bacterium]
MADKKGMNRREFLSGTAAATSLAFTIVPGHVLGGQGQTAPSDKLNVAGVGIGGMGKNNVRNCAKGGANIVALCDVDWDYAEDVFNEFPDAEKYKDFSVMLEKQKDIDAVIVATPDHNHAVVAMAAMQMGKHVYVQKPLTRTVYEARKLTEAGRKYKVATQMGNQGHSSDTVRVLAEWIWDGAIGNIREVQAWTDRPIWPQGLYRPSEKPDIPDTLAWDLWLGPSPNRPYHPAYLPWVWRDWWDFGTGAIGDMACHVLDVVFFALKLGAPDSIEARSPRIFVTKDLVKESMQESAPMASVIHSHFPARGDMPAVKLSWYDGGMKPPTPPELEKERNLPDNGIIFIGDKGTILSGTYGEGARIIPETKMKKYKLPPKTLPRIKVSHEENWMQACKSGEKPSSHFDYSGPMTEAVLLGNVALRMGKKIEWDAEKMQVTNLPEANALINPPYRAGWAL